MKTWPVRDPTTTKSHCKKQYGVCACDSAPSLMHLARIQIFPGGFFHVCNWRLLAGWLPQWAVRSRYEGHMQQQQFIDGQVQDKVHTGQATGSGCSLVNPNMQQISIKTLGLWGRVVTIIIVTRSSSRGFQKHF